MRSRLLRYVYAAAYPYVGALSALHTVVFGPSQRMACMSTPRIPAEPSTLLVLIFPTSHMEEEVIGRVRACDGVHGHHARRCDGGIIKICIAAFDRVGHGFILQQP